MHNITTIKSKASYIIIHTTLSSHKKPIYKTITYVPSLLTSISSSLHTHEYYSHALTNKKYNRNPNFTINKQKSSYNEKPNLHSFSHTLLTIFHHAHNLYKWFSCAVLISNYCFLIQWINALKSGIPASSSDGWQYCHQQDTSYKQHTVFTDIHSNRPFQLAYMFWIDTDSINWSVTCLCEVHHHAQYKLPFSCLVAINFQHALSL